MYSLQSAKFTKIVSDNLRSPITDLLFVYGTLMQGHDNAFAKRLHGQSRYVGRGWFPGKLYQIDWFPGAIHEPDSTSRVWGEVYHLHHPAELLAYLDEYEGITDEPPLYDRVPVPVQVAEQTVPCHVYLYCLPTTNRVLIESGVFVADR